MRIWGIGFDLSSQPNPDGNLYIESALKVCSGQFNIGLFRQGNLYPYFLSICFSILFIAESLLGIIKTPSDFLILNYIASPSNLLLYTRVISAILGTGVVYLTYLAGKRIFQPSVGIIASFFVAFSYIHVQQSHYEKEDMLTGLLIMVAFLFCIAIIQMHKPSLRNFVLCGIFIGLAIASKYLAWVGIFMFLVACLFHKSSAIPRKYIFLGLFSVPVGFLIAEPFALLNFGKFSADISSMSGVRELGLDRHGMPRGFFYITEHLKNGVGFPLEIIAIAAAVYIFFKCYRTGMILLVYPVSLIIFLSFYKAHAGYYLVAAVPFIAILASWFLNEIIKKINEKRLKNATMILCVYFIITPSFINCIRLNYLLSRPSTGEIAKEWIEDNIQSNSVILVEGVYGNIIAGGPALSRNIKSLRNELEGVQAKGGNGNLWKKRIEFIQQNKELKVYDIIKTTNLTASLIGEKDPAYIISKPVYNYDNGYRVTTAAEREEMQDLLNKRYRLIKNISPYPLMDDTPYLYLMDFNKLRMVELMVPSKEKVIQGASINIYERQKNGI